MTVEERMASVETNINNFRAEFTDFKVNHFHALMEDVQCIRKKLNGRPAWSVTVVITVLTSLVVGLASLVLMRGA